MAILDRKLLRDFRRLWTQAAAVAGVIAGGVATLILATGSHHSLEQTRAAYYEDYAFADVFAEVRRAPRSLTRALAAIPGVASVEANIQQLALLDIPGFSAPATARFISLPGAREPLLNRIYLRQGRLPASGSGDEVVVNESFADAHGFAPGARFGAILNGRKRELMIAGIALSPEFVFAVGPGDIMPDNRRFAVVWMPEATLAAAYDLDDAFSFVSVQLLRGASEPDVIRELDAILEPYGGSAAYGRKNQASHAWLDHELDMLDNMNRTLPPIFLLVAAFLVHLTLSRLVALEREQVGLLKAVGYSNAAIVAHYVKFVTLIALAGIVLGSGVGTLLGTYVTRLFGAFFRFPFLVFSRDTSTYLLAGGLSLAAAATGAAGAVRAVVRLTPAVAMLPPAPAVFHHMLPECAVSRRLFSQRAVMMLRGIANHWLRALLTMFGIALATGILVVSLFVGDTMESLVDVTYFLADRQDAEISFGVRRPADVLHDVARLPGVMAVEPRRIVPVRIRSGSASRRVTLSGYPQNADLHRIIGVDLRPVSLPQSGLAISAMLAEVLDIAVGDSVEIDLLEGQRRTVVVPVAALVEDYFDIRAMMDAQALSRLLREGPTVNSVSFTFDSSRTDALYAALKSLPGVSGVGLAAMSLASFRETVALLVTTMGGIYAGLAALIAFGVVYNNARIALSERARDLASLRVLGFTEGEVLRILLAELALLTLLAQPLGWALGYGLAWIMQSQLAGELMRVRLVIEPATYAGVSLTVIAAACASMLVVRGKVKALDMIAVLKTRD